MFRVDIRLRVFICFFVRRHYVQGSTPFISVAIGKTIAPQIVIGSQIILVVCRGYFHFGNNPTAARMSLPFSSNLSGNPL